RRSSGSTQGSLTSTDTAASMPNCTEHSSRHSIGYRGSRRVIVVAVRGLMTTIVCVPGHARGALTRSVDKFPEVPACAGAFRSDRAIALRTVVARSIRAVLAGRRAEVVAVQQARQRLVELVGSRSLTALAGLQPLDQGSGVVDVAGLRHQIRVVPQRITRGDSDGIRHGLPHRRGLA